MNKLKKVLKSLAIGLPLVVVLIVLMEATDYAMEWWMDTQGPLLPLLIYAIIVLGVAYYFGSALVSD